MDSLLKKRRTIQNAVNRVQTAVNKHIITALTSFEISIHFEKLACLIKESDALEIEISLLSADIDQITHDAVFATLNERIIELQVSLVDMQKLATDNSSTSFKSEIRLPKLDLPKFSGDIRDWVSFHDLFTAAVDLNNSLSGAQKLQYLKASLQGQATTVISAFQITNANYEEAWKLLVKRYQHTRELVFSTLNRFLNQPNVSREYSLRKLIDTTSECIRSLTVLNQPTDHWNSILVCSVSNKLDATTRRDWEIHLPDNEIPEYSVLESFLESRARAISNSTETQPDATYSKKQNNESKFKSRSTISNHGVVSTYTCAYGDGEHPLYKCSKFLKLSVVDRISFVKTQSLCGNCLRRGHQATTCTSSSCRKCNRKHNSLLHFVKPKPPESIGYSEDQTSVSTLMGNRIWCIQVLLSTAIIKIADSTGIHMCRALLDSGSQSSFITEECSQRIGVKRTRVNVDISGLSSSGVATAKSKVQLMVGSCTDSTYFIPVNALVLSKITGSMPQTILNRTDWIHIHKLKLADPQFNIPSQIDILLGADVVGQIMLSQKIEGPPGSPVAQETSLGWILSGKIDILMASNQNSQKSILHTQCNDDNESIQQQLERFWELEHVPTYHGLTPEELACENHFKSTYSRDSTGRIILRLPFRDQICKLGDSRNIAIRRWLSVEKRLESNPVHKEQYVKFMKEYITLTHMRLLDPSESTTGGYYIPHHAVEKETSTTTKFRVVFDASAKTTNGKSLNDILMVGPKLQDNLLDIILRFKIHRIAFIADITKMYRQFNLQIDDCNYQRIVWRETPNHPMKDFKLLTVTYGTASAPYMAVQALQQLATDTRSEYPMGSSIALSDFYVDDLMSGTSNIEDAIRIQQQLCSLLSTAGLEIRKWISNSQEFMKTIPHNLRGDDRTIELCQDGAVRALGIAWNPSSDIFTFKVKQTHYEVWTKRRMLSEISKLFDPLGWLSPVIINAKILMQSLWKCNLMWDDELPGPILKQWDEYYSDLQSLESIKIQRCATVVNSTHYRLFGFSDASERAYSACIYLYSRNDRGCTSINLLISKTRVTPMKLISIPRLELCGSVLLTNLIVSTQQALKLNIEQIHLWTDSTIVLSWLKSSPSRWKTFIANRISEIQTLLPNATWHHVLSGDNPADCASRGISVGELRSHLLWWHGPSWLTNETFYDLNHPNISTSEEWMIAEKKAEKIMSHTLTVAEDFNMEIANRCSSWSKLLRVTAYCQRVIQNMKSKPNLRIQGCLTITEIHRASIYWFKSIQSVSFNQEIKDLKENNQVSSKSIVRSLNAFLDKDALLRVGGRLHNSKVSHDQKHPVLMPRKHFIMDRILRYYHLKELHAGPQLMLASIQRHFWIIGARDIIRQHVKRCIICHRHNSTTAQQIMASLPKSRVISSRPFTQCGVDYAGPFELKVLKGRAKSFKAYVSLFICFATRAIHMEAVSDASTNAFLAALHRIISRRGKPTVIHSDCGTNFVGANKELKHLLSLYRSQQHNQEISNNLLNDQITWNFNPPAAPHFGGLWEAGVKSIKYHFKRVVGNTKLNFEEFTTLLTQIEAIVNSRPLTQLSTDPSDLSALTPGHFLIGSELTAIPEPDLSKVKLNTLSHWQLLQRLQQDFWKRWHREYLSRLQQRPKWAMAKKDIQVGDLVLVKEDNLPPLRWKLARIITLYPGSDGHVRVVTIRTSDGTYKRPIVKISPLPINNEHND